MEALTYRVLLWISLLIWPLNTTDSDEAVHEFSGADNFVYEAKRPELSDETCLRVHHTSRDICKRFYAILPYFDKEHSNTAFLHKFRATVHGMSEGDDLLDKEAAFYAAVLTPLVFLQNYRDTWCLLERFHRALRLYQISHPTEKRSSLKLLQNFRAVNQQLQKFVWKLPSSTTAVRSRTNSPPELDEEEVHDKRENRYFNELFKNLG